MNSPGEEILFHSQEVRAKELNVCGGKVGRSIKKVCLVTPKSTGFSLDAILNEEYQGKGRKKVKTLFQATTPTHRRQLSVVFTNLTEIYSFDDDSIDEESEQATGKKSAFVSSNGQRSTLTSAAKKLMESGRVSSISEEFEKKVPGDDILDTLPCNTYEEIDLGSFPSPMYCFKCKSQVLIEARLSPVKCNFWSLICCMSSSLQSLQPSKIFETCVCIRCGSILGQRLINN